MAQTPLVLAIQKVRVHLDEAWVTRTGVVHFIQPGTHRIEIQELPAGLCLEDVRVSAAGPEGSRLGDISLRQDHQSDQKRVEEAEAARENLRPKRDALESRREAVQQGLTFLKQLQGVQAKDAQDRTLAAPSSAEAYLALGKAYQARAAELLLEDRRIAADLVKLTREEGQADDQIQRAKGISHRHHSVVSVAITQPKAGAVEVTLTTRTGEARWKPSYEAHFREDLKSLELVLYASVSQRSGEDWRGIPLELSTTQARRNLHMAAFTTPINLSWTPPVPILPPPDYSGGVLGGKVGGVVGGVAGGVVGGRPFETPKSEVGVAGPSSYPAADYQKALPMLESAASTSTQVKGLISTFRLEGVVTVPADAARHRFRINSQTLETNRSLVASPRLDPTVFQVATFAPRGGFPLFPGSSLIPFVGSQRLGETYLTVAQPDSPMQLNLGPFEGVRVSCTRLSEKNPYRKSQLTVHRSKTATGREEEVREQVKTTGKERIWSLEEHLEATNDSDETLEVELRDRIVASIHESVSVVQKSEPEASQDHDRHLHFRRWMLKLAPGEKGAVALHLSVRGPRDGNLGGLVNLGFSGE